jgi:hypothetical protein
MHRKQSEFIIIFSITSVCMKEKFRRQSVKRYRVKIASPL